MDGGAQDTLQHMLVAFMEAQPEARPLLVKFFTMHATRDWVAEVPAAVMERAAPAMSAMHEACERGDYAEALAQPRVWAAPLCVAEGEAGPG